MSVRQLVKDNPDPVALLEINEHDLTTELASCAALQHMYSELALDAEEIYMESTLTLERHELDLAQNYKAKWEPSKKSDKLTETEIKRSYRGDDTWLKLKKQNNKDEINYKKLENASKAFANKNDACRSINARQLKEV